MKIVVFGATGGTGRLIVEQALALGHAVTAFVRDPARMNVAHPNLRLVQGDILDPAAVIQALQGQDAVLCALGMPLMNKDGLRAAGTRNIIDAMQTCDVRRLICLSSFGVGDSYALLPISYRFLVAPLVLRHVLADHARQETYIRDSDLDWTIVRPVNLTDGPAAGVYLQGTQRPNRRLKMKVSRADVAAYMLEQLDGGYLHQTPYLSY